MVREESTCHALKKLPRACPPGPAAAIHAVFLARCIYVDHYEGIPRLGLAAGDTSHAIVRPGYDTLWELVEWPLRRFVPGVRISRERWESGESTQAQNQCAMMNAPSFFPPMILSFVFDLAMSFALVPFARNFNRTVLRVMPVSKSAIDGLLDIYKG